MSVSDRERLRVINVELARQGEGLSGGECCYIEIGKRLRLVSQFHVVPGDAAAFYGALGLCGSFADAPFLRTPSTKGLLWLYVLRMLGGLRFAKRAPLRGDVVVSHSEFFPTMFTALALARTRKIPWIAWVHMLAPNLLRGYRYEFSPHPKLRVPRLSEILYWVNQRIFFSLARRYAAKIIVTAPYTMQRLSRLGEKVEIVPYGIKAVVEPARAAPKQYDCVFVGRFHEQKGVDILLRVWAIVCRVLPSAVLAIVGYGDSHIRESLVQTARDLGIWGNIALLGFATGEERDRVVAASRVFAFPSTYESFGIVALEAMSLGVPVVAFDLPIFAETLEASVRVPFGDEASFARELVDLIQDEHRRASLVDASLANARRYSWLSSAEIYERILHRVAAA